MSAAARVRNKRSEENINYGNKVSILRGKNNKSVDKNKNKNKLQNEHEKNNLLTNNKKLKKLLTTNNLDTDDVDDDSVSPLKFLLKPFQPSSAQFVLGKLILLFALIFRFAVSLGPYSGEGIKPLFGDFEAQRHWMEITNYLPIKKWYTYDLQWWGLDYPPLTAYHSYIIGLIGSFINKNWFALDTSRGCEDPNLKTFMRFTVISSELIFYIPAVYWFLHSTTTNAISSKLPLNSLSFLQRNIALTTILLQPALILIDHGHFQYNSVMLGLSLLSIINFLNDNFITGSILFVSSLCYKQMALYYSPIIFTYLLGRCLHPRLSFLRLFSIAISVCISFIVIFAPLVIFGGLDTLKQSFIRIFPFERGLWEGKVASFWCALNVLIKIRNMYDPETLKLYTLIATLLSISIPCIAIFAYPTKKILLWSLASCSLGFFLFSFHVHEKTILLPLMPATLLFSLSTSDEIVASEIHPMLYCFNNIATFSLYPLISQEKLQLQYFVYFIFWIWLTNGYKLPKPLLLKTFTLFAYLGAISIHLLEFFQTNAIRERYPDLLPVTNSLLSAGCFHVFLLYFWFNIYRILKKTNH